MVKSTHNNHWRWWRWRRWWWREKERGGERKKKGERGRRERERRKKGGGFLCRRRKGGDRKGKKGFCKKLKKKKKKGKISGERWKSLPPLSTLTHESTLSQLSNSTTAVLEDTANSSLHFLSPLSLSLFIFLALIFGVFFPENLCVSIVFPICLSNHLSRD